MEIYQTGLNAQTALRLSLGALAGPRVLSEKMLRERVAGRFPAAAALPPRPALDVLLRDVGADREWREPVDDEPGYHSAMATESDSETLGGRRMFTHSPPAELNAGRAHGPRFGGKDLACKPNGRVPCLDH